MTKHKKSHKNDHSSQTEKPVLDNRGRYYVAVALVLIAVGLFTLASKKPQEGSLNSAGKTTAANSVNTVGMPGGYTSKNLKKINPRIVHLKLKSQYNIMLVSGQFSGEPAAEVAKLNALLGDKVKTEKLGHHTPNNTLADKVQASVDSYYKLRYSQDVNVDSVIEQLKSLEVVEAAYGEPAPAPAPTASFVDQQNYLLPAPTGIGSTKSMSYPGGSGGNSKIIDIEYSWNTTHEDLTKAAIGLVPNGTPVDPFNDNNHGTAVLGEMVSDNNTYGVTGAASGASLKLINVNNAERGYDPVGAITAAAGIASPGDVVLIEQQTWGPTPDTYDYVPIEWIPAVYDAIKALTSSGVTVVEPAGNGAQNLDDTTYYGTSFPAGKADSGAIIVGAGQNCSGTQLLGRLSFSDYGKRVNLQGPGECVTSTGYGTLYNASGVNAYYTSSFNGTSSASPVVAAAAADLSSAYKSKNGTYMSPAQIRAGLIQYGTAQNFNSGTLSGQIGPLPDVYKSISALYPSDTIAPTTPLNFKGSLVSGSPYLSWSASTDNVGVTGYIIYRNGVNYATTTVLNYTDKNTVRKTSYKYQVAARDAAGNVSPLSTTLTLKR